MQESGERVLQSEETGSAEELRWVYEQPLQGTERPV